MNRIQDVAAWLPYMTCVGNHGKNLAKTTSIFVALGTVCRASGCRTRSWGFYFVPESNSWSLQPACFLNNCGEKVLLSTNEVLRMV